MTRTLVALALVLTTVCPTLALAQGEQTATRTEVFDDADLVTGTYQSPDGDLIGVPRRRVRHTLIRARTHYIPEMLRSVENL